MKQTSLFDYFLVLENLQIGCTVVGISCCMPWMLVNILKKLGKRPYKKKISSTSLWKKMNFTINTINNSFGQKVIRSPYLELKAEKYFKLLKGGKYKDSPALHHLTRLKYCTFFMSMFSSRCELCCLPWDFPTL